VSNVGHDRFALNENTALVTGASSGIGHGVAKGLASAGAAVIAAARRIDRLDGLVSEIEAEGGRAMAVRMDVTDKDNIEQALDAAEGRFGVADIVINNAGVADSQAFLDTPDENRDFVMDTNFKGVWNVAQATARRMAKAGKPGSIVNIASVLGLGARAGLSAYCASKGAVVQLTRSMALDLARHDIRVNAIAPGWFVTEINEGFLNTEAGQAFLKRTPAQRPGEVEELVGPIIMLASRAGSFVNGAVLPVDGAHSAALIY
ncbi:MAG: SDR family oxidoreductase, partial [Xanthomonadales bacterium]|nr:SDR family oxidoreductase [Xanthomonadales bacterium]